MAGVLNRKRFVLEYHHANGRVEEVETFTTLKLLKEECKALVGTMRYQDGTWHYAVFPYESTHPLKVAK